MGTSSDRTAADLDTHLSKTIILNAVVKVWEMVLVSLLVNFRQAKF